ncbi:hypothetical protein [Dyella nitratireducens]|uniref:Uncharacterized protein n=1 Tax=Dyella nitratireducens TaxID=1849580 RepID=A0ABQ1GZG7_9GAMM|nr:hypothetical protein [Dyella nitratireducens]GGA52771.1 hypothetical protein GCM10010981_47710 [Dyella nitratireducens]GLQ44940.1 hypothetical protein GCM10007902_47900 [Dyella nitratireducens]
MDSGLRRNDAEVKMLSIGREKAFLEQLEKRGETSGPVGDAVLSDEGDVNK